MDYEKEYREYYEKSMEYKALYLKEELTKEAKELLPGLGGEFISEKEYEQIIVPFWEKYGRKPDKLWYDYFCSGERIIDPRFVPSYFYYSEILPYVNNLQFWHAAADKCIFDITLPDIKQPETVCKCTAGFYYDANMNMISRKEAVNICLSHKGQMVIKPSIGSGFSKNIYCIDPDETSEKEMEEYFEKLGSYFIVQSRIEQHLELAKLNPSTVNTIRVNSLMTDEGVYIASMHIRVGDPQSKIVHQGSSGWHSSIEEDGTLSEKLVTHKSVFYKNRFGEESIREVMTWGELPDYASAKSGYKIPAIDKVCEAVCKAHKRLPHFRFVGWDFTVDTQGEPVFIEFNLAPSHLSCQLIVRKPLFGDKTEEILEDYFIHKTLKKNDLGRML
ncbi:MAG: hypothetical protein K5644_04445 [Lachnospiraceae bacterium]|nr:hypothetical protein [Lachnospiraceae bacterium]